MKKIALAVVGAAMIGLGGFVLFKGLSVPSQETVFQLGQFKAEVQTEKPVPGWAGAIALAGGAVLLLLALRK
ncbi:hypothetical protein [Caldimonas brevitalea]|uniref:DUF3185 domain-containing protein n=1 Tax=Caldimonas brevitalea TaxID=413882 RepID=A0A0G3BTY2_9BURK|nr:hypothetical protein [Caldimonas brevitalea]AKJ29995.1 hypothetical protein AAW51_3304 [Caldimonas brevitalea]